MTERDLREIQCRTCNHKYNGSIENGEWKRKNESLRKDAVFMLTIPVRGILG